MTLINQFNLHNNNSKKVDTIINVHFTDGEVKVQRSETTCPSHTVWEVVESKLELGSLILNPIHLTTVLRSFVVSQRK